VVVKGQVSLVGAGPGDPGLLTRTAVARLRAADLVLYDALIGEGILKYARKAQRFFVGKRAGRHAMSQEAIHALMIRAARRGRKVVRLKGGDPFIFGRGGESSGAAAGRHSSRRRSRDHQRCRGTRGGRHSCHAPRRRLRLPRRLRPRRGNLLSGDSPAPAERRHRQRADGPRPLRRHCQSS
jgi:hypothetical protein